jgi:hypothetical protein
VSSNTGYKSFYGYEIRRNYRNLQMIFLCKFGRKGVLKYVRRSEEDHSNPRWIN